MLLIRIWNYIRGYVIIIVNGYFLEKFINICIHRQIFLWDLKRRNKNEMTLKVSIKGFKVLRPIAKKTKCSVHLVGKRGLPFTLSRYKKRKTFLLGACIFIFLFYVLTSFIWSIEIIGNKNIKSEKIVEVLETYGVGTGKVKFNVNTDNIVNNLMLDIKELAWVGVVLKGTKLKIEVVERVTPPKLIPTAVPCKIIARSDGIIKSIVTKVGEAVVKEGDTVTKGQTLISGLVKNKNENESPLIVHAIGSVKARTWYESKFPVKTNIIEKERTGDNINKYSILLLNKKFSLFGKKNRFIISDKVEIKKNLYIGEDIVLPFGFIIDRYYENIEVEKELDIDTAKQLAADTAYRDAMSQINEEAQIVKTTPDFIEDEELGLAASIVIECIEEIGMENRLEGTN